MKKDKPTLKEWAAVTKDFSKVLIESSDKSITRYKMKNVIFEEFSPRVRFNDLEDPWVQINGTVRVLVTKTKVEIINQGQGGDDRVFLSRKDFEALKSKVQKSAKFPAPRNVVTEEEIPVAQKVVKADFSRKTFTLASKVIEVTHKEPNPSTIILDNGIRVLTFKDLDKRKCIHVYQGYVGIGLFKETFESICEVVANFKEQSNGKVLEFPKVKRVG